MKTNNKNYELYKPLSFFSKYWIELVTLLIGLIAINLIFIAGVYRETDTVNAAAAGQLGDFVGGYIGTFFTLFSVVFLYRTLNHQRETSTLEKFETKYFELIKMHRDNVAEISIGNDSGRKIFVALIREFRAILKLITPLAREFQPHLTNEDLFIISYYALFFGVGPNSTRMLRSALSDYDQDFIEGLIITLDSSVHKDNAKVERGLKYVPFEGHQSRLGHYYRHLYQTICYVDKQNLDINKYDYIKTIRAQLSTHEQALLFINSLSPIGKTWNEEKLITRYRLIKNIPKGFFDEQTELNFEGKFDDDYFEWQEK